MDAPGVIELIGGLLGMVAVISVAILVVLRSTKNEIISDQNQLVGLLEKQLANCKQERDDERVKSAADTARLQGQVDALTGTLADRIVAALAPRGRRSHDSPDSDR